WKQKKISEQVHPIYLVWSGPGKSRLLDEFPSLCGKSVATNQEMKTHFDKTVYVFKISFENVYFCYTKQSGWNGRDWHINFLKVMTGRPSLQIQVTTIVLPKS